MIEVIKSITNKVIFFLIGIFLFSFLLGWFLPIGIDKVDTLSYGEYLFSTYTVFTQFGFLMFSFIVAYFINKEYSNKTILFYKLLSYNSLKFYLNKIFVLICESFFILLSFLLIVSLIYGDFSLLFLMLFLLTFVMIQYILIIGLISMLSTNILISIGFSIFYWILSVVLVSLSDKFRYIAIFDASNELYDHVAKTIKRGEIFISMSDLMVILTFIIIIFLISVMVAKFMNKRWLKLGIN